MTEEHDAFTCTCSIRGPKAEIIRSRVSCVEGLGRKSLGR